MRFIPFYTLEKKDLNDIIGLTRRCSDVIAYNRSTVSQTPAPYGLESEQIGGLGHALWREWDQRRGKLTAVGGHRWGIVMIKVVMVPFIAFDECRLTKCNALSFG